MGTQGGASALRAHSRFFDHLVDLVPAKYYLDSGEDKVNLKYLKKSARDEAKAAFKQQYKAAKRAKLDPEQAKGTVQLQREAAERAKERQQNGAAHSDSEEEDGDSGEDSGSEGEGRAQQHQQAQRGEQQQGAVGRLAIPKGKPPSREELQQRLQAKLEEMRKARKAEEQQQKARDAKQWRDKSLQEGRRKVARGALHQPKAAGSKPSLAAGAAPGGAQQPQKGQAQGQQGQQQQGQQQQQGGGKGGKRQREEEGGLTFNKLDFGTEPRHQKKRQRKQSKQQLLEAAQAKQSAAAELAGSADGKAQLAKEAWGAALQRAKGDKVLDDPRLLKRSLKKEAKLKAKKAQVWQERLKAQSEQQQAKQQKRRDNIDTRIKAKQDKKKQKRENKLLRAGFEGRKQGFIDTPKRPATGGQ
ncbi:surfeit locus 6-like protein [Chlorella sorokiniana]|uniref:Surfeit locus 6-like protein n=1 Tax=Chlorella sorokiniana TaxID=3076 RepID=A0A2P6TVS2_CHLSO|nr:surfeit locus 6-like protein [Chlorella sorokiniana]|eukprot:PRW58169.1 surfeit locus 6-like protein [Chlorella sorokiniana]